VLSGAVAGMAWLVSEAMALIVLRKLVLDRVSRNFVFWTVTLFVTACCLPICSGGVVIPYGRWLMSAVGLCFVVLNLVCDQHQDPCCRSDRGKGQVDGACGEEKQAL